MIKRILILDDDDVFRIRLVRALENRGYIVAGYSNGNQALQDLMDFNPDSMILDLKMPGDSGLKLLPRFLEKQSGLRVLVLTGYGSIATALEAVHLGAVNYLTKPADADQILAGFSKGISGPVLTAPTERDNLNTPTLDRVEWEHIQRVLSDCQGNISKAAEVLGIHRRSLQRKLSKFPSSR